MTQFFVLLAIEILGLASIWLLLKARVRKTLELDSLLSDARKEVRALSIELNETADRNITLIEDRLEALRGILSEADRRMGVMKRELGSRAAEKEVYEKLSRSRPVLRRDSTAPMTRENAYEPDIVANRTEGRDAANRPGLGAAAATGTMATDQIIARPVVDEAANGNASVPRSATIDEAPIRLELGRRAPEILRSRESVVPPKSLRESTVELYRKGFSAEVIAAKLGATLAEIDLLVSLEENRLSQDRDRARSEIDGRPSSRRYSSED